MSVSSEYAVNEFLSAIRGRLLCIARRMRCRRLGVQEQRVRASRVAYPGPVGSRLHPIDVAPSCPMSTSTHSHWRRRAFGQSEACPRPFRVAAQGYPLLSISEWAGSLLGFWWHRCRFRNCKKVLCIVRQIGPKLTADRRTSILEFFAYADLSQRCYGGKQ